MQSTDFHPQKVFRCPCLLNVFDNIFNSGDRSLDQILTHLQNLEKYSVFELIKKGFNENL